jgi:PPM family protein phosphatase
MNNPQFSITVNAFGLSDVGLVRTNNEDNFLFTQLGSGSINSIPAESNSTAPWIFIVADGMGGGQAGEVASQMATELVAEKFGVRVIQKNISNHQGYVKALTGAVEETNRTVFHEGQHKNELKGMGTTLTAAAVCGKSVIFAQLGDSRAYLLRDSNITQMTKDQSLVAQMVAMGKLSPEAAKTHPRRNVILQALGVQPRIDVVISSAELSSGDRLVLCSDGLWGKVESEEIKELVERFPAQTACESLVCLANERGGEDNITVVIASFTGDGLRTVAGSEISDSRGTSQRRWWFWPWLRNANSKR